MSRPWIGLEEADPRAGRREELRRGMKRNSVGQETCDCTDHPKAYFNPARICPARRAMLGWRNISAGPMILNIILNENAYPIRIPDGIPEEATDMFARMDADMDRGWQMSRVWVDHPDSHQRCQIVANRLLTAMENHNQELATMMAAYIVARMPGAREVVIDTSGDMTQTQIMCGDSSETGQN